VGPASASIPAVAKAAPKKKANGKKHERLLRVRR
jgi:hypothetical protein